MASRFWVGGSGTWDNSSTANWSATSGGASGASAPTVADNVTFDSNSGTAAIVTVASTAVALNTTINKADVNLSLSGNCNLTGVGGQVLLTTGTITLNTYTLTCVYFASNNANARTIAFGTGAITVTGSGTTIWSGQTLTGMTISGNPTVNFTYSGSTGTRTINHGGTAGGTEANAISANISAGSDAVALSSSGVFKNVNFTGYTGALTGTSAILYGDLTLGAGSTMTVTANSLSFISATAVQKLTTNNVTIGVGVIVGAAGTTNTLQLQDNCTLNTTKQVTLTSGTLALNNFILNAGFFASSNSNTRSIAFGTGNITITQNNATVWSMGTATNFSYTGTPTVNLTYAGSTGTRTILSASTTGASETTVPSFNITAGSDIVTMISAFKSVNFTGFTGTLTNALMTFYGNLTFSSGMTMAAANNLKVFSATSGVQQITTNGLTINSPIAKTGAGTMQFQDALTQNATYAFTFATGTVQLKDGVTSTVGAFATSGTTQKTLESTTPGSTATLSQASGTVNASYLTIKDINATGGATFNALWSNNNVDAGDNSGWVFGDPPIINAVEYTYALRSLTEPRRF